MDAVDLLDEGNSGPPTVFFSRVAGPGISAG
jgi:hypothetical protein